MTRRDDRSSPHGPRAGGRAVTPRLAPPSSRLRRAPARGVQAALALALCAAVLAFARPASAAGPRPLTGGYRDVPRSWSAVRDTPVFALAYGPRPQLPAGGELALVDFGGDRLGASLALGLEDVDARGGVFPDQAWRAALEVAFQHRLAAAADGRVLELVTSLGYAAAGLTRGVDAADLTEPDDIPFGGGGLYLALELAGRLPLGDDWVLALRVRHRWFTNAWATLVGQGEVAATVASTLKEGLAHAPALDVALRWRAAAGVEPLLSLHATWLVPADDLADDGWRLGGLLGVALAGEGGSWLPFVALDAGSGVGMLTARRQLRLALGVRFAL